MSRKRTISFDVHDEALIAQIQQQHRPFATPHTIVRLAARHGLRLLVDGLPPESKNDRKQGGVTP